MKRDTESKNEYKVYYKGLFIQAGHPATAAELIPIGGTVPEDRGNQPVPIPRDWVQLEAMVNRPLPTTETNELGRFTFNACAQARDGCLHARPTWAKRCERPICCPGLA